jgi:MFS family permease
MKTKDMNHRLRDDITFKIDFEDNRSLHNWIEQYGLTCASGNEIGNIGSSFFVGTFIGSILIPRAADVVGRKPMFVLGLVIYIFVIVGLIFASNYYTLMVLLAISGIGEAGRYYVAYVYVIEIFHSKYQSAAGIAIFICFSASKVFICLQFMLIPYRNWLGMAYISFILAVGSLIMTIFTMPESPRFLYSKKKFEQATKILQHV